MIRTVLECYHRAASALKFATDAISEIPGGPRWTATSRTRSAEDLNFRNTGGETTCSC